MFLIIIFGNGFRYGNTMLIYTQVLGTAALLAVSLVPTALKIHAIDLTLLCWQMIGLLVIPLYIYAVRKQEDRATAGRIKAEETTLRLLDHGPMPVFAFEPTDAGPVIVYANKAAGRLLGDAERVIGKEPSVFCLPEDRDEMRAFCEQLLKGPGIEPQETYVRGQSRGGDTPARLICTGTRIHWRDKTLGVCFIQDIGDREALNRGLDAPRQQMFMSTLVAGIVHDFRNILTSIIGQAEILQMETKDDRMRSELQAIIESGERGASIVSQLLALARKVEQSDSLRLTPQQHGVLERLIGLVRFQLPPQIRLRHVIEEQIPPVELNIVEMEQILLNLVSNAAHAIEGEGEIDLHIRAEQEPDGQPCLLIRVSDTGKGIPEELLDQVTRPFWTSREKEGGTGLGLTMVQRIVKRHRGRMDIASKVGEGTTMTIMIPATSETISPQPAFGTPSPHAKTHQKRKARILLVDDAEEVLRIHQALISRMGHAVTTAADGKQALDLLRSDKRSFDLVVTDYRMPELDGLGLLEEIRRNMKHLPVIMITAYGEDRRLKKARELGAMLLNKPVNFHNLEQAIQQALMPARSAQKP